MTHESQHDDPERDECRLSGDAVWAQNQWPAIGLVTGGGVGLALSVLFAVGWGRGGLYVIGMGIGGCLLGLILAKLVYRH